MAASGAAAEATIAQKLGCKNPAAIFQVVIFALNQVITKAQEVTAIANAVG
jgi:hypothetical protein